MKFVFKKEGFNYREVQPNQFFVWEGCLCQRHSYEKAFRLTNKEGKPDTRFVDISERQQIDRILPRIEEIEY